jgi:hypothetical protein
MEKLAVISEEIARREKTELPTRLMGIRDQQASIAKLTEEYNKLHAAMIVADPTRKDREQFLQNSSQYMEEVKKRRKARWDNSEEQKKIDKDSEKSAQAYLDLLGKAVARWGGGGMLDAVTKVLEKEGDILEIRNALNAVDQKLTDPGRTKERYENYLDLNQAMAENTLTTEEAAQAQKLLNAYLSYGVLTTDQYNMAMKMLDNSVAGYNESGAEMEKKLEETKKKVETLAETMKKAGDEAFKNFLSGFELIGQAMAGQAESWDAAWKAFAKSGLNAIAAIVEALGNFATAQAVIKFASGDIAGGAANTAAAIGAYTAAGIIRAIPLKQGGEFEVPPGYPNDRFMAPLALTSGERVTVEPLGKRRGNDGGMTVVNQYIEGSVWTTKDLGDLARSAVRVKR